MADNSTCIYFFCTEAENLDWYCYLLISICFISLVFGFLGNTIVLVNYAYRNKSWTSSTIFLFNLALCDFTWIVIVPISVYFNLKKLVVYSVPAFCQFKRIFFNINIYGSIFFLMLISFDRYVCSVHPIASLRWWNKKKAKICTTTIWVFIFLESVPDFFYTFTTKQRDNVAACLDNVEGPKMFAVPFTVFRIVLGFIIPGTVIFTCYVLTLKVLRHLKKHSHTTKRIMKPLMLVSATMVVFVISFVPYHVMVFALLFYRFNYSIHSENIRIIFALYQLSEIFCCVSSCADPIIFVLASNKFQHQLKEIKCYFRKLYSCCRSNRVEDVIVN